MASPVDFKGIPLDYICLVLICFLLSWRNWITSGGGWLAGWLQPALREVSLLEATEEICCVEYKALVNFW